MVKQKKNGCVNAILYFGMFVALGLLTFILLIPKKPEHFYVSSRDLYLSRSDKDYDRAFEANRTTFDDKDETLLMNTCYQFPTNLNLQHDCYEVTFGMQVRNFTEVNNRIQNEVKLMRQQIGKRIKGPIYAMLSQAPFMRDEKGNVISVQYNIVDYNQSPVNVMKKGDDTNVRLFISVTLYFTRYFKNRQERSNPYDLKGVLSGYISRKPQCYLSCFNDIDNKFCGCINQTSPYVSKCVGTPANGDLLKAAAANFRVLYLVNHRDPILVQADALESM